MCVCLTNLDIDECGNQNSPCEQQCRNTNGSFECECNEGFLLNQDGISCRGKRTINQTLAAMFHSYVNLLCSFRQLLAVLVLASLNVVWGSVL